MKKEKTVREQIEDIKEDFCQMCCKYYEDAENKAKAIHGDDETLRQQIIDVLQRDLHRHCKECPLDRL